MRKALLSVFVFIGTGLAFAQTSKPNKVVPVAQYYQGGHDSLYAFINRNVVYPPYAKRNRVQGEIILSFTLESDGSVKNVKCTKDVSGGAGLSAEAIRVLNLVKFTAPGFSSPQSMPVIFKL